MANVALVSHRRAAPRLGGAVGDLPDQLLHVASCFRRSSRWESTRVPQWPPWCSLRPRGSAGFSQNQRAARRAAEMVRAAGVPLEKEVAEFFFAIGVPVYEGDGSTETPPVVTLTPPDQVRLGSVGNRSGTWKYEPLMTERSWSAVQRQPGRPRQTAGNRRSSPGRAASIPATSGA